MFKKTILTLLSVLFLLAITFSGMILAKEVKDLGEFKIVLPIWNNAYDKKEEHQIVKDFLLKDMLEEKGMKVDFEIEDYQINTWEERLNIMIASGEQFDVFKIGIGDNILDYLGPDGVAMPLNDLLEKHGQNILKKIPEECWRKATIDDKIYFIPNADNEAFRVTVMRSDLLNKAGLDKPSTIGEMEEAFAAYKEMGYTPVVGTLEEIEDILGATYGIPANDLVYDNKGNVIHRFVHPDYLKVVRTLARWVEHNWLPPDVIIVEGNQNYDLYVGDKAAVFMGGLGANWIAADAKQQIEDAEFTRLWYIDPEEGTKGGIPVMNPVSSGLVVPKFASNPEAFISYMDYLMSDTEHLVTAQYGIEGVHYTINKKDDKKTMIFKEKYKNFDARYDFTCLFHMRYDQLMPTFYSTDHEFWYEGLDEINTLPEERKVDNKLMNYLFSIPSELKMEIKDFEKMARIKYDEIIVGSTSLSELEEKRQEILKEWQEIQPEIEKIIKETEAMK